MTYFVLFNLLFALETATEKEQNDGYVYHVYQQSIVALNCYFFAIFCALLI